MAINDNIIKLDELIKRVNSSIDTNINLLNKGADAINNYGKNISNIPSQYVNNLNDINEALKKIQSSNIKLTKEEKERINSILKLNQEIRSNNQTTLSNIRVLNQQEAAKKRQEKATKDLNSAYLQLSKAESEAARRLQDLIARGKTAEQTQRQYNRELKNAKNEFDSLRTKVLSADNAVGRWNRTNERTISGLKNMFLGVKNLVAAFGIVGGLTLFANLVKDSYRLIKELQGLNEALKMVTGSEAEFAKQQIFLSQTAEKFGVDINTLTEQFTQFYVSAKDKLAGEQIQNIFSSVTKAGAKMGLTVDAQKRAFLALNQMMSKGVISSEELRGQLGEALPGAFGIMAKAMKTTEKGLAEMLKNGELLAKDVLPKFAKELEKAYGIENVDRIENITSAQNRLSNAWVSLINNISDGQGVISKFFITALNKATELLNIINRLNKDSKDFANDYIESFNKFASTNTVDRVKEIDKELKKNNETLLRQTKAYNDQKKKVDELNGSFVKYLDTSGNIKKEQEILEKLEQSRNTTIIANKKLNELRNSTLAERNTLERQFIDLFTKRNKSVTESVALDYTKSKTNEQLRKEIEQLNSLLQTNEEKQKSNNLTKKEDLLKTVETIDLKKLESKTLDVNLDSLDRQLEAYNKNTEAKERDAEATKEWLKEYKKSFSDDFISQSGFDKIFFIIENFDSLKQSGVSTALAISEAFQQAYNTINQISQRNFEAEKARVQEQYDFAIQAAGDSETARAEIERQRDAKLKEIQRREAKSQRDMAIFNATIDTAQGVVGAISRADLYPYNFVLAGIIGALGSAQIAYISSQPLPQFYKGTENAPEGWAWTQERGPEVITDKDGNLKTTGNNKGAQLTYLEQGDKVYKSRQDYINKELGKLGIDSLGSWKKQDANIIINDNSNISEIKSEISNLANIIKNKEGVQISIDEYGFRKLQGNRQILNSKLTLKGRDV